MMKIEIYNDSTFNVVLQIRLASQSPSVSLSHPVRVRTVQSTHDDIVDIAEAGR